MSTCEVKSLLFPPTRPFDSLTGDILTLIFKYLPWSSAYKKFCVRYFVIRLSHFVSTCYLFSWKRSSSGAGIAAGFQFSCVIRSSKHYVPRAHRLQEPATSRGVMMAAPRRGGTSLRRLRGTLTSKISAKAFPSSSYSGFKN